MPGLGLGLGLGRSKSAIATSAFAAPQNVVATEAGSPDNNTLSLSWDAPAGDAPASYSVEYRVDGGAWVGTQSVSHPTVTYDFTGLADGIYVGRVRAAFAEGNSGYVESNTVSMFVNLMFTLDNLYHTLALVGAG